MAAQAAGASKVIAIDTVADRLETARALGAEPVHATEEDPRKAVKAGTQVGGVDVAVDAVGSKDSIDTVLRVTKAGGRVVLSGMPSTGADLSPVWFRELELTGTYASSREEPNDRPAFETALEMAAKAPLDGIVGARYPLYRWREALDHAQSAGRLGTVKVAFDVRAS
jgi:threonine dehydrogenase-like Zn-dependent dehydrogenase